MLLIAGAPTSSARAATIDYPCSLTIGTETALQVWDPGTSFEPMISGAADWSCDVEDGVPAWAPRAVGVGAAGVAAAAMLLVPLRGVTTVGLFWLLSRRLWGEAVWAMPEGMVHLLQLLGDGLVGVAGAAGFVALALMLRPAPSDA